MERFLHFLLAQSRLLEHLSRLFGICSLPSWKSCLNQFNHMQKQSNCNPKLVKSMELTSMTYFIKLGTPHSVNSWSCVDYWSKTKSKAAFLYDFVRSLYALLTDIKLYAKLTSQFCLFNLFGAFHKYYLLEFQTQVEVWRAQQL